MYLRFFIGFLLGCFGATAALAYNFSLSTLHGVSLTTATSLQFGPDHRLYVSQVNGQILALTIQRLGPNNYQVTATETINLVRDIPNYDDNGTRNFSLTTRQVTGLLVVGTAESPILYVTSSDPRIGGGSGGENDLNLDTNSGVLSRLMRSGNSWTKVDLVRGLPRSEENHASNGMQLDAVNHRLLLAQGGNTNAGGPSINFAYASETALSAAILSIDLTAIDALPVKTDAYGQKYLYNLPTLDDPNPARNHNPDGSDVNDPFGGNDGLNQAKLVPGGPVQIYSPGHRNPYDLVLTRAPGREGRLYSFDNGANAGWGGYPKNEGPSGNVTNEYVEGEPGYVNNLDSLHLITPGFYRGHPNPIRANPAGAGWFHFDNNLPAGSQKVYSASPTTDWPPVPVAMANPVEGDFRQPGVDDGALLTYPASTNGITEYVATNFNGEMQGNLIAAAYDGKLLRIALNQAGTAVTNGVEFLASGFGAQPLDVTAPDPGHGAPFVGTIWIAHYSPGKITVLEPADFDSPGSSTCTGIDSFDVDEDGDGFSNADEIANGTDPCSGAVRPPDADGDNLSDLLDRDDDNDGLPDTEDPFPLDPRNGYSLPLPHHYELFNETGVGFFGVGFTGLMMNPGEDYLNRANEDAVVAGGTAGLFTISAADSGTPRGAENAQKDAYHFAFNSDEFTTPYLVTVRLAGPFFNNTPAGAQRQGIYIGSGDQDNYVSLALHANNGAGGIEVVYEVAGTIGFEHIYPLSLGDASTVDLSFLVDPIAATVQPLYQLAEAGALVPLGSPIHVTGEVMKSVMGPTPLAIGLFANASGGSPTFSATWDYFDIAPLPTTAVAKLTIDPSGSDMVTGSTYQTGTFKLQNLSTGGQHIEAFTLDISTAIFPDVVFDTTGTAGDPVAKDFQQNSVTSGVSVNHGGATHPHNGVDGEDGYDHVDVSFNSFPPNGQLTFSIDVDPTSVKGAPQPGPHDAASVSGLELIGATATVYFSDGTVQRTRLGRLENSVDASYGWLRGDKPPKPSVLVVGKSSPVKTNHAEIVRVSGPPGLTVSLVVIEGGLYTAGLPNGGYDIDPFEANTAIKVTELSAVLNNEGYADITVTPTKTDPEAGLNFVTATLLNTNGVKGPASDPLLIWYDPSFGGSDTQPPSAPGNVSATSITSRSITLAWSAASDNVGVVGYDILRDGQLLTSTTGLTYTDIGLDPEVAYSYAIVARDESGNDSTPATVDATTTPGGTVVLRVNAGGNAFTDSHGAAWTADNGYNTGTTSSTSHAIDRAIDDTLFKSRRLDSSASSPDLIYSFTLPNGDYEVQLFFSENDTANSAVGKRVFDVLLENSVVIDNFDIFAAAGAPYTAVVLAGTTTVSDGQLNIAFGRVSGNPQVNAIKVIRLSEAPADTQAPTEPGALSFTNVTSSNATVSWSAATDNVGVTGYRIARNGTTLTTTSNLSFNDSGLSPATTYQYSVVALDAAGNTSSPSTSSVTTAGGGTTPTTIRVNAGGPAYVDSLDRTWSADTGYNSGKTYSVTTDVSGTVDPTLYQTERYDDPVSPVLQYTFPVVNGSYLVRLHFAETYSRTQGAGLRVFDIDLEGSRAFENVDIYALAGGGHKALVLEQTLTVSDGQLNLGFAHEVENPKINAIEILPADTEPPADTQPPTAPGALTFTNVTSSAVTLQWSAATDNIGVAGYRVSRDGAVIGTTSNLTFTDTGLSPATTYAYSVVAFDDAGNDSTASSASIATASGGTTGKAIRVNAGGPAYVDSLGRTWSADTGYNTGSASSENVTVTDTNDPYLYKTNRYDAPGGATLTYTFAVPNGAYLVRLHFAETYGPSKAPGKRVFDIDLQSERIFEDVDIFSLAGGGNKALVLEHNLNVSSGQIAIKLIAQAGNSRINALEIIPSDEAPADTQAPTAPGALSFTNVTSSSATVSWAAATDNVGVTGYRIARNGTTLTTTSNLSFNDSGLSPATTYQYSVVALDAAGNTSSPSTGSVTTASGGATPTTIRVNAGGPAYVDSLGQTWSADTGYNSGKTYSVTTDVSGTVDPTLYQTERYDDPVSPVLQYTFPVVNGSYLVRLHFAETYSRTQGAGLRVFDIDLEGSRAFENVDIYALAGGGHKALVLEQTLTVSDGQLNLGFAHEVENPKINAIEILPADTEPPADTQPPTAPGALTFTNVTSSAVTFQWSAATDNVGVAGYRVSRDGAVIGTTSNLTFTDTGLSPATTYAYSVVAFDDADNASTASSASVATASGGTTGTAIRVNAGGPAYVDALGRTWSADTGYNTGSASSENVTVTDTSDPYLFKTNRYDAPGGATLTYTFPVPNGAYLVRLHFAETYGPSKAPGKRVFDIDLQSERIFEDVDIFSLAGGGNKALVLEHNLTVSSGQIAIKLIPQVGNSRINALEIIPSD